MYVCVCVCADGVSSPQLGTQAEGLCSSLCERLMNFVVSCHELVQSAVSPGPATEGLLKVSESILSSLVSFPIHPGNEANLSSGSFPTYPGNEANLLNPSSKGSVGASY